MDTASLVLLLRNISYIHYNLQYMDLINKLYEKQEKYCPRVVATYNQYEQFPV